MRNLIWTTLGILLAGLIGGCTAFEDPSQRATENADSTIVAKTISAVDIQLETVEALRQTADSAGVLSSNLTQAVLERDNLQGTVNAMSGVSSGVNIIPTSSAGGINPTAIGGGPAAGTGPSPAPGSSAIYSSAQTATDLTADFCAVANVETFSMTAEVIYFVVVVQNFSPGIQFTLRVTNSVDKTVLDEDVNFWVSDRNYDRTCIYYGLDSNNLPFVAGNYEVALLENGVQRISRTFIIN